MPGPDDDLARILAFRGIPIPDDNATTGCSVYFAPGSALRLREDLLAWRDGTAGATISYRDGRDAVGEPAPPEHDDRGPDGASATPTTRYECTIGTCDWKHDQRGLGPDDICETGSFAEGTYRLTARMADTEAIIRAHFETHTAEEWVREVASLRERLAAANERAEWTEATANRRVEAAREREEIWRDRIFPQVAAAIRRAERAEARLDALKPLRTEWSTENTYADPDDGITDRELAERRAATYPDIHSNVLTRQLYAGPWLRAGGFVPGPGIASAADPGRMPSRSQVHANWSDVRAARMDDPDAQAAYRAAADEHDREEQQS